MAVPLTHRVSVGLRRLQDQTELLAEEQLHDCTGTEMQQLLNPMVSLFFQHQTERKNISTPTSGSVGCQLNLDPTISCKRHLQQAADKASVTDVVPCAQQAV